MDIGQVPDQIRFGLTASRNGLQIEFDRNDFHTMPETHFHREYELYYLFSGERNYFIHDRSFTVQPGDIVLIGSDIVHRTSDAGIPGYERMLLYYDPAFFDGFSAEHKQLLLSVFSHEYPILRLKLQQRLPLEALLLKLLWELTEEPPGYEIHAVNAATELLLFTAREFLRQEPSVHYEPTPVQQKITAIVRHIHASYAEPLELDDLSSRFYISKSHLSRMFKEVTGFGFSEYVNLTRVRQAQHLLKESRISVTAISEQCGFGNFSHFGKIFKQLSGVSPREYRLFNS